MFSKKKLMRDKGKQCIWLWKAADMRKTHSRCKSTARNLRQRWVEKSVRTCVMML